MNYRGQWQYLRRYCKIDQCECNGGLVRGNIDSANFCLDSCGCHKTSSLESLLFEARDFSTPIATSRWRWHFQDHEANAGVCSLAYLVPWHSWCHGGFVTSQHVLHQSVGVAYRFLQEGGSPPFDKVCWRSPQLIPSSASRSPRVFNHVQCFFVQSHAGWKFTFGNSEDL